MAPLEIGFCREDRLANTRSAKKRIRQNARRRMLNRMHRTRARSAVRQGREGLAAGEVDAARKAVLEAVSQLDRAASRGVIHRSNAARRKSRLMKKLAALEQGA